MKPIIATMRPLLECIHPDDLKVTDLPFVGNRKGRRCFWKVSPTGKYHEDCLIGKYYALEAMHYMRVKGCPPLLGWITRDMPRQEACCGLEVGFMHAIAERID